MEIALFPLQLIHQDLIKDRIKVHLLLQACDLLDRIYNVHNVFCRIHFLLSVDLEYQEVYSANLSHDGY